MKAAGRESQQLLAQSRLRRSGDFKRLKETGARSVGRLLILNWKQSEDRKLSRAGFVASRSVGGSVQRNRARRLLREAFRLHQGDLAFPVEMVLIARHFISDKSMQSVEREYMDLLRSAGLLRKSDNPCEGL